MIRPGYVLLMAMLLFAAACGDSKETERSNSPRIKKSTKMDTPTEDQQFVRGTEIPLLFSSNNELAIDSVQITLDEITSSYYANSFGLSMPSNRVGNWRIRAKVFCGEQSETHYRNITILMENEPEQMTYEVVNTYAHNTDDYTQGLLIHEGLLYESTGRRGESTLKKKNITTAEELSVINLDSELFGEGLALYNDQLFQLTYTSGKAIVYDLDFNTTGEFTYQTEGWGLTTLDNQLIMTNGSEILYFVDPSSFTIMKELGVYDNEGKVTQLNELEVIDGLIYANIYQEDYVVVIDPETGEVKQSIDFSGLLTNDEAQDADVLNGIAVNPEDGKIYVTGKWWPKLFEVTIEPKTLQ